MTNQEESVEPIYIGPKEISKYLSACFFAYSNDKEVIQLIARGNNIKRAIDVAAILIRQYVENPTYEVIIDSEEFENRHVSTIDIIIKGKKIENESKPIQKD